MTSYGTRQLSGKPADKRSVSQDNEPQGLRQKPWLSGSDISPEGLRALLTDKRKNIYKNQANDMLLYVRDTKTLRLHLYGQVYV